MLSPHVSSPLINTSLASKERKKERKKERAAGFLYQLARER